MSLLLNSLFCFTDPCIFSSVSATPYDQWSNKLSISEASPGGSVVKNPLAKQEPQETRV